MARQVKLLIEGITETTILGLEHQEKERLEYYLCEASWSPRKHSKTVSGAWHKKGIATLP
jgi:hypothetical protein